MAPLTRMEPSDTVSIPRLVVHDVGSLDFILWAIVVPIFVICALVVDVGLLIKVFRQKARLSITYYERALYPAGFVCISVSAVRLISENIPVISPYIVYYQLMIYPRICTFLVFSLCVATIFANWIILSISFAGYIRFCHPGWAPWITTKKATRRIILGTTLFSIIFNLPRLFGTNYRHCARYVGECYEVYVTDFGTTGFYKFFNEWMTSALLMYVPYLCVFALNILVIRNMFLGMVFRNRGFEKGISSALIAVPFLLFYTPLVIAKLSTSSSEIRFSVACAVSILELSTFTLICCFSETIVILKKHSRSPGKT